jgi:TonB family protein
MTATAGRLTAAGPRPKELWLTVGLSILLHGLLLVSIVMVPRFRFGTYVTVPVSYTVDLVSATPGGRAGVSAPAKAPSAPAKAPSAPAPRPAPPVAAPRVAPPPPPAPAARSSEELTLPGKRPPQKAPPEIEPSLRPPSVAGREKQRPAPADLRPRPPVATQAPPAPAAPAAPPVASAVPVGPPAGSAETASGKASGLELASGDRGEGSGGSALGYYLGLVDYKISTNWNPVATGGARDSVAVVRFRVLRSGNVRDAELETSSGDAGLDAAAMRAIRQSLPLPPFPNLLTEPFLNLRYRFVVERG